MCCESPGVTWIILWKLKTKKFESNKWSSTCESLLDKPDSEIESQGMSGEIISSKSSDWLTGSLHLRHLDLICEVLYFRPQQ